MVGWVGWSGDACVCVCACARVDSFGVTGRWGTSLYFRFLAKDAAQRSKAEKKAKRRRKLLKEVIQEISPVASPLA